MVTPLYLIYDTDTNLPIANHIPTTTMEHPEIKYTCEVCGTPMVNADIKTEVIPHNNSSPMYFCTVGCYYLWADTLDEVEDEYH